MRLGHLLLIAALAAGSFPAFADPPAKCKAQAAAQQSTQLLRSAELALSTKDYERANGLLKQGLVELDYFYQPHDPATLLDDTGMHLVLADAADQRGDLTMAATIRRNILGERLRLFGKFHPQGC